MADYNPDLQRLEVFSNVDEHPSQKVLVEPNMLFPREEQVTDFPVYRRIKLSSIVYKLNSDKVPLMGIQLKFTNGVKSPLFQTPNA